MGILREENFLSIFIVCLASFLFQSLKKFFCLTAIDILSRNSVKSREIKLLQWLKSHICFFSGALNVSVQDPCVHCFYNKTTLKLKNRRKRKECLNYLTIFLKQKLWFPFNIFIMYPAFLSENQTMNNIIFTYLYMYFFLSETDVIKVHSV